MIFSLFLLELQKFADETGLAGSACHFPPETNSGTRSSTGCLLRSHKLEREVFMPRPNLKIFFDNKIKKLLSLMLSIALGPLFLIGCGAAHTAIKTGDSSLERGDQYGAASQYLDALRLDPKNTKALTKLSAIAKGAYEQKLSIAKGHRDQGNLPRSLTEYKELALFLNRLDSYKVLTFVPINVEQTIQEVSAGAAEERYQAAESAFNHATYEDAIRQYREAMKFVASYKDSGNKIAEAHYRIATGLEQSGRYRSAAESYTESSKQVTGYRDAAQRAAAIYYQLGSHFLASRHCRNAFDDFSQAVRLGSSNPDIDKKLAAAKECGTTRLAFVNFENATGTNLGGMALGDVIFELMKTKVQSGASQFMRLLDREGLLALGREQRISAGRFGSEATVPTTLEGVDYLVFGKLNQVRDAHAGQSRSQNSIKYTYWYYIPYVDDKGKEQKKMEYADGIANYTVLSDRRTVTIGGTIRLVEVKSGAVLVNHQISEERSDQTSYAVDMRADVDLNSNRVTQDGNVQAVLALASARRELRDAGDIAKEMVDSISGTMAVKILQNLDVTSKVPDPSHLAGSAPTPTPSTPAKPKSKKRNPKS